MCVCVFLCLFMHVASRHDTAMLTVFRPFITNIWHKHFHIAPYEHTYNVDLFIFDFVFLPFKYIHV